MGIGVHTSIRVCEATSGNETLIQTRHAMKASLLLPRDYGFYRGHVILSRQELANAIRTHVNSSPNEHEFS